MKEVEKKTLLKQMIPVIHSQAYDLMLVMQTETIVFFLDNKTKFCSAVLIVGSRSAFLKLFYSIAPFLSRHVVFAPQA